MPAYQATFRHRTDHDRWTARFIRAANLTEAARRARLLRDAVAETEGWPPATAEPVSLQLVPDSTPDFNPTPRPRPAFARARALADELAGCPRQGARWFRAACVIAGVHPFGSAQGRP